MSFNDQLIAKEIQDQRADSQEPYYAQIDPNINALILSNSTENLPVVDSNGDPVIDPRTNMQLFEQKVIRPHIFNYIMILSHLQRTSNLTQNMPKHLYFKYKQTMRRSKAKCRSNPDIMDLLQKIDIVALTICFGDARGGKRAEHVRTTGKTVTIAQGVQPDTAGPWWSK